MFPRRLGDSGAQINSRLRESSDVTLYFRLSALLLCFAVAACQQGIGGLTGRNQPSQQPVQQVAKIPLSATVKGQKVGDGPVRVALLVPSSAQGAAGTIGKQLTNAAKLAVRDFGAGRLQVVIKDTRGQAATAAELTEQARNEGASLILGPLFSANVSAANGVTKSARLPMIAFTSDVARAAPGTYLLSFTPQADVRRTLGYGFANGAERLLAILPDTAYGKLVEREMRRVVDANRVQIVSVVRYKPGDAGIKTAVRSALLATGTANAIYIPDGGAAPAKILAGLKAAGAQLAGKVLLGSGQWDSINLNNPDLEGAFFAGPSKTGLNTFQQRYRATYGSKPATTAALAYDAVSLAAELIRRSPNNPFTAQAIQSRSGFSGATGLFRFQPTGLLQRGLVVNRVRGGQAIVVSPSPTGFSSRR